MNTLKNIILYSLGAATVIALIMMTSYTKPGAGKANLDALDLAVTTNETAASTDTVLPPQNVRPPQLPDSVDFAGEALPIENFDAKERFDRELIANCFRHSATFMFLKRANRYFPIIEPILKKNGIPDDVKYLAVAESALANAVSPAGARGFWQFMRSAGQTYGLEINKEVDERYHLEKATVAACKYLKDAHKQFGSWTLAAASYNMGRAGLKRRIQEQGGKSYFDLFLNAETSRYILRIMAIKEVMKNPKRYGFNITKADLYPPLPVCTKVEHSGPITNMATFAAKYGLSYRMFKVYNPWLRSTVLTNKNKKKYYIKIPKQKKEEK